MKLTAENYYSVEANREYWSGSFVKAAISCQAEAIAEMRGEYVREPSQALTVGSYVDASFEGTLDVFKARHPELFKRDGSLKSEYIMADEMIGKAESDPVFMDFMTGEKQKILTGELFGMPFKAKLDVLLPGKRIVDLKTTKDMKSMYKPEEGRVSFADFWNWPLQMAIYQALEGHSLPCYLAVVTKEDPPDIAVVEIPQHTLDAELKILESCVPYFDALRQGVVEPVRCEKCRYCRMTKKLDGPVSLDEFAEECAE